MFFSFLSKAGIAAWDQGQVVDLALSDASYVMLLASMTTVFDLSNMHVANYLDRGFLWNRHMSHRTYRLLCSLLWTAHHLGLHDEHIFNSPGAMPVCHLLPVPSLLLG